MPLRAALAELRRAPHALYPAFGESIDQPLGMVRILDLARPDALDRPLGDFVRPASIVPETMKGFDLLEDLCRAPMPAALVVDEFGSMAGLVTVEDLIEVVVGDLVGEHEVVRARVVQLGPDLYRVDGTCRVDEFNERLGPLLPEGEYETVAGLFLDSVGRIPPAGERLVLTGVELEILERNDRRILWLRARIRNDAESA
jgi:CBS domain containing-hemolysin-like protein